MNNIGKLMEKMNTCDYKFGSATARTAGASPTSKKQFLSFLTCLDIKKWKNIKITKIRNHVWKYIDFI